MWLMTKTCASVLSVVILNGLAAQLRVENQHKKKDRRCHQPWLIKVFFHLLTQCSAECLQRFTTGALSERLIYFILLFLISMLLSVVNRHFWCSFIDKLWKMRNLEHTRFCWVWVPFAQIPKNNLNPAVPYSSGLKCRFGLFDLSSTEQEKCF